MALLRFAGTVGFWTLASRILGFIRDILIARFLGTTGVVEAFFVATATPQDSKCAGVSKYCRASSMPPISTTLSRIGAAAAAPKR